MSSCLKERKTSRLGGEMIGMYILDTGSCSGETEVDGYDMGVNDDGLCSCIGYLHASSSIFFFGRLIRKEHANANDSHSRWKRYGPAAPPVHMTNR